MDAVVPPAPDRPRPPTVFPPTVPPITVPPTTVPTRSVETRLPTVHGDLRVIAFEETSGPAHLAVISGDLASTVPLVRLHSECLTGDVLGSIRCDCGAQLEAALAAIGTAPPGVLLYLRQEGRGIGLVNKLHAYNLQDHEGLDTIDANLALGFGADERDFGLASEILRQLGVGAVRLLTNNPRKIESLAAHGIAVLERVPLVVGRHRENERYLDTKRERMGHLLEE